MIQGIVDAEGNPLFFSVQVSQSGRKLKGGGIMVSSKLVVVLTALEVH